MNNGMFNAAPESQPIDISYQRRGSAFGQLHPQQAHLQQSVNGRSNFRRDSVAHSQGVGGISWGSVTIGSWLKDEVLMQNQLNLQNQNYQQSMSPPLQASYLPDLEANYCKDYSCCGQLLPTLHDLLKHYEESHISPTPPTHQPKPIQNFDTVSTTDVFIHNNINNQMGIQQQMRQQQLQPQHNQQNQQHQIQNQLHGQQQVHHHHHHHHQQQQRIQQQQQLQQQRSQFGFTQPSFDNQQMNQIRDSLSHQGGLAEIPEQSRLGPGQQLNNSQFDISVGNDSQFAQHSQQQSAPFPMSLDNDDSAMDLDDEQEEQFIDDPSRNLYVAQGSEKPFTCPVIGCNKTYKNQNGLKYHRIHGHQNQKLHLNPDGTYSIIDPNDGAGLEQDKPYRCEVCGKRYKNLNGLKYHRGHTTH